MRPSPCRLLTRCCALTVLVWALLPPLAVAAAAASAPPVTTAANAAPDLVLEVRLGEHLVADAIGAYQHGNDVYLPIGELAQLLTLAIRSTPAEGQAAGYILDPQRGFHLDLGNKLVIVGHQREVLDVALLRVLPDDLYVASKALARWLPVDLDVDMASLTLNVRPREQLPVQARLERERKKPAPARGVAVADPGFARLATPHALASMPFIDQTVSVDGRYANGKGSAAALYTAYLTADLLGLEAALYLTAGKDARGPAARLTLGRIDPDGGMLGRLGVRSLLIGHVAAPTVSNIALGGIGGQGVAMSNRAVGQTMRFDRHTLQGDLAPGWDVELYFNGALIGFQQSRADGQYRFDDQPLIYGANEFRLVFHGPLGQLRIERHYFLLEQSLLAPGEFAYGVSAHRDRQGERRAVAQFEWGLHKQVSASGALVVLPLEGRERRYANAGVHGYWRDIIVSADLARVDGGGHLVQLALKTRLAGLAVGLSQTRLTDFVSELYSGGEGAVRARDEVRVDGVLGTPASALMPVSLLVKRDHFASGPDELSLAGRISAYRYGTSVSNSLRWKSLGAGKFADGSLQVSRRVAGIGISGQLHYTIRPGTGLSSLALAADKHVGDGYLVGAAVARSFADAEYSFSASLNKSLGSFGMGLSAYYSSSGGYGVGLQLFMAMGREPRSGSWLRDAAPMAAHGAVSARVFLDKNQNGIMDGNDEPIQGAGFMVNNGWQPARTGEDGIAYLSRLPVGQHLDVAIDATTLEDPQWVARQAGWRVLPRAGKVGLIEVPVGITGEVDGTTYLVGDGGKRGMGGFELELIDAAGVTVGRASSASDGYFVLNGVSPGTYQLRIAPAQLARLGLRDGGPRAVTLAPDGSFVNGVDFIVTK